MRKKSSGRRAVYGILGAIMALTAINSVSAKETKPYEATELRLAKGSTDYNLLEGIEFDKKKYDVEVTDEGDFDIDLLGKYEVAYTLVPKDGDASELENTRATEVTKAETTVPETAADETTTVAAKPENVKGEGRGESSSTSTKESEAKKDEGAEIEAETKEEIETSEAETARDDVPQETSADTENSESSSYEEKTEKEEKTDTAEERAESAPEVDEKTGAEQDADISFEENADTAEANVDAGQADGVRATLLSTFVKRMTSRVYAAEKEANLDESSREIHFTRDVRVVMDPDSTNIQYDEPVIRISSSTALYELTIGSEAELDTDKKKEKNEKNKESDRDEADDKPASESELEAVALADELEDEAVADRMDEDMLLDEAFSFDGTTESGEEYILTLKKPELILGDAILADKHGKEIKKASVRIRDDEALKAAVNVTEDENGRPKIDGLCPGTYEVELSAVDPSTKKEVSCARVIEIVAGGEVSFEAPVLCIGTRNESYDLTLDVIATDENGEEVTPVYVVNEEELLNARIDVEKTATASAAKKSSEDSEDAEDEIVRDRETIFKPGTYHVTLGAKHPESGDEFTVEREIQIVDGYYIYAPTLDIQPGSKDYDLLSGVEVRKGSDGEVRTDIEVRVTDISSLKAAEVEEGEYSQENTEEDSEEEKEDDEVDSDAVAVTDATTETERRPIVRRAMKTRAVAAATKMEGRSEADKATEAEIQETITVSADDELPAVKPGFYTVTLEAQDPETGETMTVVRNVRAGLELEAWMMEAELTAYGNKKKNISYLYGEVNADEVGFKDPSGGESGWLRAWSKTVNGQETVHNDAADFLQNKMNELSPSKIPYGVTNVARLQDGKLYQGWLYAGAGAGVSYITYHYGIGNNTLVGMLGYGGDWYEVRGINYVKKGRTWSGGGDLVHKYRWFTTGRIKKEYYSTIFNGTAGNTEESVLKDDDLIDTTPYVFSGGETDAIWQATAQVSRDPYTGYFLTRSLYDDLNGDWGKYAESGNAALGLAEWKNVGFGNAGRNKPSMREGGTADVTIRVKYPYLDQDHLNWAGLAANPKKVLAGVDKNSSISIDGQGKQLKAGKKENNQIGNAYTVGGFSPSDKNNGGDGIQIELKNFAGIAQDYVVTPGGYLRLAANLPGNGVTASNVGILNNSGYRDLADTMVELVGPDTDQEMQLFNIWNINDVIIRAGKAKMTPVRVVVHGQAGANQRIDLNGQTIEFYQLQNSAGWNGTTTINGKAKESDKIGRITFKNEKAPEYQAAETDKTETPEAGAKPEGDVPATGDGTTDGTQEEKKDKIENGNLLRLKNLTLESDIELEKSEYVGWSQHKGWTEDQKMDRANYSPLLIDGTFVPNGHKIKLVKENGAPYKDGEIVAGFANETDMNSTAILDPADFELMNPKQGERADDGKYYFLVPANEGRTIKVKAMDTLPIKVTPGFGGEHDSYYKDYATALNAIIENGTGIDYTITNLLDAEFTEAANLHLNAIKKANASKLTFVSGISQNKEDKGRMYRITLKLTPQDPANTELKALKLPSADENQATTAVEFRDVLIRSDYDFTVEDKMIVRKNPLVIFNNGGSLTFGQNCNFVSRYPSEYVENAGKNWEPMYVKVYAGAYFGTVNTDADITVTSGTFDAIYGGNQNGYYTGKYTLNVEQQDASLLNTKADKDGRLEIRTIDGAGASDQEKPANKNTSIHITGPVYDETNPGELQSLRLENLYNYDLLELTGQFTIGYLYTVTGTQEGGTKKEDILGRGELNAQKISAYEGKTIMTDKSLLALSNPDGIKQIGSLRRSETVDANVRPSIMLSRPKDCNQPTCANVLTITAKDPLYAADALVGQIRVSYISNDTDQYNFSEQAKAGDYVIKLPNVEKSMFVTAKNLNANFKSGLKLIPQHEDKTKNTINALVLGEAKIQIIIGYNTIVEGKPGMAFPIEEDSVASALDALIIRMKQVPEIRDYTLSFAVSGYTMTETDHQMMQDKRLRALNSLNWTGRFQYDPNGVDHVKEPDDINAVSTVIVNNDLNFRVKNTEISALKLQYAERHNIFANGSKLKMGLHVTMLGNEAVLPILYGGADGTAAGVTAEDLKVPGTSLTIQSGRYHEIYGGGKGRNAAIQGDVEINLDGYAYVVDKNKPLDLSMTAVHGSGSDGSQLDRDRTSSIKILNSVSLAGSENWEEGHVFSYPLNIKSVDRFDHFYVGAEEQLKLNPQVTIGEHILSESSGGVYTGELHLYTADIMLKGKTNSHVGNIAAHGKYNSLQLNIDETTRKTIPLLVDGTLSMLVPEEGNQLLLKLEKDQDAYNGAILLSFNREPNAIEEQYKTHISKYSVGKDEKNIILEGAMVYVLTFSHKEGDERFYNPSTYPSIAKALNGIGERMTKKPEIAEDDGTQISIFGDSYQFTAKDLTALEYAAKEHTADEAMPYNIKTLKYLGEVKNAKKISWCNNLKPDGATSNPNLYPAVLGDGIGTLREWWLPGKSTDMRGLALDFKSPFNIYADGKPLQLDADMKITAKDGWYPSLYGGSNRSIDGNTDLTVRSGRYNGIHGGGYGENDDTALVGGDTAVTLVGKIQIDDTLSGGGKIRGTVKGKKNITITPYNLIINLTPADVTVKKLVEFDDLKLGNNVSNVADTSLTVLEEMRGTLNRSVADDFRGNVSMVNTTLTFKNKAYGWFSNLTSTGKNNLILLSKDTRSYPLKLREKTSVSFTETEIPGTKPLQKPTIKKELHPIKIGIDNHMEDRGDIAVIYDAVENAVAEEYGAREDGFKITRQENKLIIDEDNNYFVHTKNGEEGLISVLMVPPTYKGTINGTGSGNGLTFSRLYDHKDSSWKNNAPLVARDLRYNQDARNYYYKKHFDEVRPAKMQGKSSSGETYDIYEFTSARNNLPVYAGLRDTFTFGAIKELSSADINNAWNTRNTNSLYYYDSTNRHQDPKWENFGEGKDLYDWETGEWVDDPDVTVRRIKRANWYKPEDICSEFTWTINDPSSGILDSHLKNSSMVIDFDEKGDGNVKDFSEIRWNAGGAWAPVPPSMGQISFKNLFLTGADPGWNGSDNQKTFKMTKDGQVMRFDSWVGNGAGYYWTYPNRNIRSTDTFGLYSQGQLPNSVIQVKLSDTYAQNPAFMFHGQIGKYMIKAGAVEHSVPMDIANFMRVAEFDTGESGVIKMISIRADGGEGNLNSVIRLKGTGILAMVNTFEVYHWKDNNYIPYCWFYRWMGAGHVISNAFELMNDGFTYAVANYHPRYGHLDIRHMRTNEVISNGHKLKCLRSDMLCGQYTASGWVDHYSGIPLATGDLTEGYYVARTFRTDGVLDPTDFELEMKKNPETGELLNPASIGLFFTREIHGGLHHIRVVRIKDPDTNQIVTKPIKVIPAVEGVSYYDNYKAAFEAIQAHGESTTDYTVKNLVEWDFTEADAQALVEIDAAHAASLTLEGGLRNNNNVIAQGRLDTNDVNAIARDYYRVRLRKQALMMPDDVPVTFNNIILKYDQGNTHELNGEDGRIQTEDIVFINNGSGLRFGDKVQFLKHQDEEANATVYGGSVKDPAAYGWDGFSNAHGKTTNKANIQIASGTFTQVYGGGTKAQGGGINQILDYFRATPTDIGADITVTGGTIGKIFGGGLGREGVMHGNATITIGGKTEITSQTIYGGGDGAELDGSTLVDITAEKAYEKFSKNNTAKRTIHPGVSQDENIQTSVYGGGHNAAVTGNTSVNIKLLNDATNHSYYFGTLSGFGTVDETVVDENGEETNEIRLSQDNVKGTTEKVVITQDNPQSATYVHLDTLSGFSELDLGKNEGTGGNKNNFNAFHVTVNKRFDGNASEQSNLLTTKRGDTVKLYAVALTLRGEWQGHIGSMEVTNSCAIKITKTDTNIYPLILDGQVTQDEPMNQIRLRTDPGKNAVQDKILSFTDAQFAIPTQYVDGEDTGLSVDTLAEGTVKHIIFTLPHTHIAESYVTYATPSEIVKVEPGEETTPDTNAGRGDAGEETIPGAATEKFVLDEETDPATTPKKVLHYIYDAENNEHAIKGGYVVALPKKFMPAGTVDSGDLSQYLVMNTDFINQTDKDKLGPLPTFTNPEVKAYEIRFEKGTPHGQTDPIVIDDDKYWYLAHFTCVNGDPFTLLTDVSAPIKTMAELQVSLDTEKKLYQYSLTYRDFSETDDTKLPWQTIKVKGEDGTEKEVKHLLPYNANGVTSVYWSLGSGDGAGEANLLADWEAAKRLEDGITVTPDGTALRGQGTVKSLDGKDQVSGGDVALATIQVPQALVEANEEQGVIWAYLKDKHNNTVKVAIPLNQNIINVRVPLEVYVVAVKKENTTDAAPELLAPNCYVKNEGVLPIAAKISGFKQEISAETNQRLRLSDKTTLAEFDGVADEISLFIRRGKKDSLGDTLPETLSERNNVLSLKENDPKTWLSLGELSYTKMKDARTKDFTFDALYNPQLINELGNGEWIKSTMSYNFSIVR